MNQPIPASIQALAEQMAQHLAKQQQRSVSNGSCAYRALDGCMCAIGVLIPDEVYQADRARVDVNDYPEGLTANGLLIDRGLIAYHLLSLAPDVEPMRFDVWLSACQRYHDGTSNPSCNYVTHLSEVDNLPPNEREAALYPVILAELLDRWRPLK